jgi:hypothetical protein
MGPFLVAGPPSRALAYCRRATQLGVVRRLRDVLIGLLVLGTVFITAQGAVGYFGFPSKSPMYWIVPGLAVLVVVVWYFRSSEDWTAPPNRGDGAEGGDKRADPPGPAAK